MNSVITFKSYIAPPFCEKEILRYSGCGAYDENIARLSKNCIDEIAPKLSYRVCFCELNVSVDNGICYIGPFKWRSEKLALNLKDCKKAIVFAATVGTDIDRAIARYGRISPSKAIVFQAIGAERIEALCDAFCNDIEKEYGIEIRPRFSPGYGDLSLECQRDIFALLDCERKIGLTLNASLLMSPSKSVTAIVGIGNGDKKHIISKCAACNMKNCAYRGIA